MHSQKQCRPAPASQRPSQSSRSLLGCLGSAPVLPFRWTRAGSPGATAHSQMGGSAAGDSHASGGPVLQPQQSSGSQPSAEGHSGGFPATATVKSGLEAAPGGHETVAQSQSPANGQLSPPGPQPALTIVMQGGKPRMSRFPTATWPATYSYSSTCFAVRWRQCKCSLLPQCSSFTTNISCHFLLQGCSAQPASLTMGLQGQQASTASKQPRTAVSVSTAVQTASRNAAVTSPSPTPSGGSRQSRCVRAFASVFHLLSDAKPPMSRRPAKAQTDVNRDLAEQNIVCVTPQRVDFGTLHCDIKTSVGRADNLSS